jgi:hypothetical protein
MAPVSMPERAPNVRMLAIVSFFLIIAILLMILRPGYDAVAKTDSVIEEVAPEVTRTDLRLLDAPGAQVSERLSQPILVEEQRAATLDLKALTTRALRQFGHSPGSDDRLRALLVDALERRQSDAYIDALLNTAAARGEFVVPRRLRNANGRLETQRLLEAIVMQTQNQDR